MQRKAALKGLPSVTDLREDPQKQHSSCVCMLAKISLLTLCDLSVAWFYASFSEIPWNCVFLGPYILRASPGGRKHSGHFGDCLWNEAKLRVNVERARVGARLLGGRDSGRGELKCVVLSRRFITHAGAGGRRRAGLRGRRDGSRIPLLLSSVTADGCCVGKMHCFWGRCYDSVSGACTEHLPSGVRGGLRMPSIPSLTPFLYLRW